MLAQREQTPRLAHALSPDVLRTSLSSFLRAEADAILSLINHIPTQTLTLINDLLNAQGKVIFSGVGKSGLIAQKLAATYSSLGIASFALHPCDALHGDLGALQRGDIFIALSKSATGDEFSQILPILKPRGITSYLLCCKPGILCEKADAVITLPIEQEACPLNLAPTSSSTAMMAFGDAVALTVSSLRGFNEKDFARNHPAGALGKRLLLTVASIMHKNDALPLVLPTTTFKDVLIAITSKKRGLGIVVDNNHALRGIITDGDLRRAYERGPRVFDVCAQDIATMNPKFIAPHELAYTALLVMEQHNITSLVVVENEKVVGLIHIHDVIKAGL
ncbi:MAG: KpsF/GutQ family sugar-phosphate isomerase [Candidatus Babeliales bacterium]|jgi:arabinose-5-phosphate isomerase